MTEFTDREAALEAEMAERGADRVKAAASKARSAGRASLTGPGRRLIRKAMSRMVSTLEGWIGEQSALSGAARSKAYPTLTALPPRVSAMLSLRTVLDLAHREASYSAAAHAVGARLAAEAAARWLATEHSGAWTAARRRAAVVPDRAASRLRRAARLMARDKGAPRWSVSDRLRAGGFMVMLAERDAGLFRFEEVRLGRRVRLTMRVLPEVAEWIIHASEAEEALEPLYMPMVDVPGDWAPGQVGGYATGLVRRRYLVKNRSRITRELVAGAEMPEVYAAVNSLQRTAWEVNPDVLQVADDLFRAGLPVPGLEGAEDEPLPARPAEPDREWARRRFLIKRGNLFRQSRRAESARILWMARRLAAEGRLHFPQQLDFRGRIYPIPQFLNPQGPDLARGLLRFGQGEWIQRHDEPDSFWIHGANCLGLDKLPLDDRIAGVRQHSMLIQNTYRDPIDCRWWQEAEEPWQFLAWCLEAGELYDTGRVLTRVPCYVDGTNNGLQILSLLLRDPVGGAATNCMDGPRRDIYQDVADDVTARLRAADHDLARAWLAWLPVSGVPRAAVKRAVMTLPYGCTAFSRAQYLADWYEEEVRQGRPQISDRPWGLIGGLAAELELSIRALVGPALGGMEWLRSVSRSVVDAGLSPTWIAPTGFPVRQSYTCWETRQVRAKLGERIRWVRSRREGNKPNPRRHVNGLAPNFVHSLDAAVLARAVAAFGDRPVSTIHDSFGTLATHVADLGRLVREAYAGIFAEDQLRNLREQLGAQLGGRVSLAEPPTMGSLDPAAVLNSEYMFS